jgi:hypothetical protein
MAGGVQRQRLCEVRDRLGPLSDLDAKSTALQPQLSILRVLLQLRRELFGVFLGIVMGCDGPGRHAAQPRGEEQAR